MLKKLIIKHALRNALMYNGKAEFQAVLNKVLGEKPEWKNRINQVIKLVKETVQEINSLSLEEQVKLAKQLGISLEREVKELGLPELPGKYKEIVMRFAPFPSGPLHLGSARCVILNDEYVKRYKGKLLLVIDDTIGSEKKPIAPEAYEMIIEDLKWLGIKWDKLYFKSDRVNLHLKWGKKLLELGHAYVCKCPQEIVKRNRILGIECACRNRPSEENLKDFEKMLDGTYREKEAFVRLKTDMKHPNPAFRDRGLLRICEREHPRVGHKYRVWPMLEFSWAIDDHLLGITHILRGKDLVMEDLVELWIWNKLGWKAPEIIHYGILKLEQGKLSRSVIRRLIAEGKLKGWEDPRTGSLPSFRKRGIKPEAIRKFVLSLGLSLADIKAPLHILYSHNRELIDKEAKRFFFVKDPKIISIEKAPKIKMITIRSHPEVDLGQRQIPVDTSTIFIEKEDFLKFKGKEVRLIGLFNIKLDELSTFLGKEKKKDLKKIHWVSKPNVKVKVIMPDGTELEGIGEPELLNSKVGDMVQLERFGYCRVDSIDGKISLYFAHD